MSAPEVIAPAEVIVPASPARATTRVVYMAMKPQLRGRIRRNVTTLLELGADVTILTVASNKDFFVGLEHPRLRAEFLEARSLYIRWSLHTSSRARELADRRRARAAGEPVPPGRLRKALLAPVYLLGLVLLGPVQLLAEPCLLLLRGLVAGLRLLRTAAAVPGRRLPLPVRQARWRAARRRVLLRRRVRRWWRRRAAPALLRTVTGPVRWAASRRPGAAGDPSASRRRRPSANRRTWQRRLVLLRRAFLRRRRVMNRVVINRRLAVRRALVQRTKDLLRPWHRPSRFFAFWKESAQRGLELAPDLVVSSDLPGLVGAGRVARRLGLPHLHDCHELYLESTSFRRVERRLLAPMERYYFRRADSVVAVNESIAAEYRRRYGRSPVVVRNCASRLSEDLAVRDLRVLAGIPATARVVLYQGGFSAGRGLDVCVGAVAALPADAHLVLLGFGPLRDELVEMAETLGVADHVHVLEAVPPEELAACTVSATVGLMPYQPVSRNNLLALPNKIFEYTAVGVPIVTSDLPELRRIALGDGCGEVYDPFDAASLATALRRVLDPQRYPGYRDAARRFGLTNVWEKEREILVAEMRRVSPDLSGAP